MRRDLAGIVTYTRIRVSRGVREENIEDNRGTITFCTCEFTRLMVLNQDQEKGVELGRSKGEDSWSSSSS